MSDSNDETGKEGLLEAEDDEARRLEAFAEDSALDEESFRAKHGTAFLLLTHTGSLHAAQGPRATMVASGSAKEGGMLAPRRYLVFPVRKSDRSPIGRIIGVGRTRNNDVVIRDASLSKFHAFFQQDEQGWLLRDGRSQNGTFVNDAPAPPQGEGEPARVQSNARVRFGAVELTFLEDADFQRLVARVCAK